MIALSGHAVLPRERAARTFYGFAEPTPTPEEEAKQRLRQAHREECREHFRCFPTRLLPTPRGCVVSRRPLRRAGGVKPGRRRGA